MQFEVHFLGVGEMSTIQFAKNHCKHFELVKGKRNHAFTIIKQIKAYLKLDRQYQYQSIHIVNEQLFIFFYFFVSEKHVVLDIFDSYFLRINRANNQFLLLKRMLYGPVAKILVTDENRKSLMPDFVQKKTMVIENYPNKINNNIGKKTENEDITLLYCGWVGVNRGSKIINKLLDVDENIKVIMAGWISDWETQQMIQHPRVDYRGVLSQKDVLKIAASESDYMLCLYAPVNQNNINASPNKIYDAIQANIPIIINAEVKIADFVSRENLGIVLPSFNFSDYTKIAKQLRNKKRAFKIDSKLRERFTWENVQHKLLLAHRV